MSKKIADSLQNLLADLFCLSIKTQCYHWNVKGLQFTELHILFEKQYDDLIEAIDLIAERIRQLGFPVPAGLKIFAQNTKLKDADYKKTVEGMMADLETDHRAILSTMNDIIKIIGDHDEATKDILIERLRAHGKHIWFLESLLSK